MFLTKKKIEKIKDEVIKEVEKKTKLEEYKNYVKNLKEGDEIHFLNCAYRIEYVVHSYGYDELYDYRIFVCIKSSGTRRAIILSLNKIDVDLVINNK